jgi:hypothetical protein
VTRIWNRNSGGLAAGVLPDRQIEQLIRLCWDLGTLDNAAHVALASVPQGA